MRLVHISDIHVYDPEQKALERARSWGKVAIAIAAIAGVLRAGDTETGRKLRGRFPRLFVVAQALVVAGVSAYLIRKLVDHGHRRAYRALRSEEARRVLFEELKASSFDHLLVTGDVALTPSSGELERAADLLRPFWDRLHIVPGNHDVPFIEGASGSFDEVFAERLEPFPFVRDLGEGVVLGGIDTTVRGMIQDPWAALSNARGRITAVQMAGLLERMPAAGTRILAMHHHLRPNPSGLGGLVDRIYMGPVKAVRSVKRGLEKLGVDLLLHGHQHWNYHGPGFFCAGTSALRPDGGCEGPTFNVYDFDGGQLVAAGRREIQGSTIVRTEIPVREVLPGRK